MIEQEIIMKMKGKNPKHIGFTVSEDTYNDINAFCDKHGVNTTTIMRVAVEMYLEDMKDVKPLNEKRS